MVVLRLKLKLSYIYHLPNVLHNPDSARQICFSLSFNAAGITSSICYDYAWYAPQYNIISKAYNECLIT